MENALPDLIDRALAFALEVHKGQRDRYGEAYILHPLQLMSRMDSDHERLAAILHDTIEDSDRTLADIRDLGMPEEVITAVALLTHDKENTPYMDYVRALQPNDIARKVKLADLRHNMDLERVDEVREEDVGRLNRYRQAMEILFS